MADAQPTQRTRPTEPADGGAVTDSLAGSPWRPVDLAVAGLVGLTVAVVAVVWRTEIVSTDPWHYVQAGLHFPSSDWVPLGYTRYGMILPVVPVGRLLGNVQATYYFWPVLGSAVLAATTYLVARRWWNPAAGILAVGLTIATPLVFLNLSRYYPDLFSMAIVLAALAVAVAVRGRQLDVRHRGTWPGVLLVGLLLGWSFEARETAVFSWPIVIVVLWVGGRVVRNGVLVAAGVLFWMAVDVTISAWAYGDPLLKLHTFTRQDLAATSNPADVAVLNHFVGQPRMFYLTYIPRTLLGPHGPEGGRLMVVVGGLALLGLFVRNRAVRVSAASFLVSFILFVGIAGFFVPGHPAGRIDVQRYWVPFVPLAALAVAGLAHVVARGLAGGVLRRARWTPILSAALAAALLVVPTVQIVRFVQGSPSVAPNGGAPFGDVRSYLAAHRVTTVVWSDRHSTRLLPIYRKGPWGPPTLWTARIRSLTGQSDDPEPGDYVLLVRAGARSPCGFCTAALAPWRREHRVLPAGWTPVLVTPHGGMTLYHVHAGT